MSVLESRLKKAEEDVEKKAQEIRDELNREINALKSSIEEIRKTQEARVQSELQEVKGQQKDNRNYRIAVWGAVISTLALLATLALSGLQNCDAKKVSPPAAAAEAE